MTKRDNSIGVFAALIPNIIFGFSFLFSKIALSVAHPLIILAVRFTLAFLILNVLWGVGAVRLNFKGKNIKKILIMAVCQPLLYFIFELYGINSTSSAISGVIISLVPIAVIIISSVFLKEKPTVLQIVFSCISLLSVAAISILSNNGNKNSITGVVLLLCAVLCAAVFNILSRGEAEKFTPVERTYMMFAIGAVGFDIIAVAFLKGRFLSELVVAISSYDFCFAMFYLAGLSSIAAFLLYNWATTKIDAVRASSFSNVITVVSVFAGVVINGEKLTILQFVFCALIIIGVYGANRPKNIEIKRHLWYNKGRR